LAKMTYASAQRTSTTVGVITAVAGTALLDAPQKVGPLIGLTSGGDAQLVGALDVALAPGLIFGRPRWAWLAVRATANLATAAFLLYRNHDETRRTNGRFQRIFGFVHPQRQPSNPRPTPRQPMTVDLR
jgi:hypothetical protein